GPRVLNISSIVLTGINKIDFTQTSCGSSLSPGASCVISVSFRPTRIGPRRASVSITDSTPGSPQSVALSGTGVTKGANATLSPTRLTIATQLVGTTSPGKSVKLNNYGTMTLNITGISASGDFTQTHTCGSGLAPGASCTISVDFKPTVGGPLTGTLSVADNAPSSPQTVSLSGTGTVVKLSPSKLQFFCCPFGPFRACVCTPSQTTTLTNVGSTSLDITGIAISGPFSETNSCNATLAAGSSCNIDVSWSRSTGSGEVSVSDDGGASPQTVSLI